jgi:hypothetical protein
MAAACVLSTPASGLFTSAFKVPEPTRKRPVSKWVSFAAMAAQANRNVPKADLMNRLSLSGRVARLSGNVRQPDHFLANYIAGHKAERRPGAGEEWRATTKHDGVEVQSILIDKTKVG